MKVLVVLVFLVACLGGNRLPWPEPCKLTSTDVTCRIVDEIGIFSSTQSWISSGYSRQGDAYMFPVTMLIAGDRTGCVVSDGVAAVARRGESWPCPEGWRQRRP